MATTDWLFVVGLSLEISGAVLVGGEIVFASAAEIASRGGTYPGAGGHREAQRGPALTWTGLALLAAGFVLLLVGYIVLSSYWYFFAIAVAIVLVAILLGRWIARTLVTDLLFKRASRYKQQQ
jgi:hypothetical protein